MRIFDNADYRFIPKRKAAYVASGVALALGIAAMLFNTVVNGSWQNYGVDFTGGSLLQVEFVEEVQVGEIRAALSGLGEPDVTRFAGENVFTIRAPQLEEMAIDDVNASIQEQLGAAFGEDAFTVNSADLVGPKIGRELQRKAGFAILFSFVLTLIYLAIRFEFRFGVAAVIATLHDILITLGFLSLFQVSISLTTVAAVLTIVGYSLNDTIVVFDRIRENMNKKGARKLDQIELIDRSINETLPRTVLTSGTTLAVLLALLILGPAVIRDFSIVLILGVLIGTYSSIFVASPALVEIRKRFGEGDRRERRPRREPATV